MNKDRRVVVTGLGIVSPVGNDIEQAWANILAGRSGIAPITQFEAGDFPVRFAGEVKNFDVEQYIPRKEARKMDGFIHYGIAAALQALADGAVDLTADGAKTIDPERVGVFIGSGIGGLLGIEQGVESYIKGGPRKITPFYVPRSIINMISGHISIMTGIKGPNLAAVTACTTGTHCIGLAARSISYGDADLMLAGGAEMGTTPTGVGGFAAARALSTRNDAPEAASRPWDVDRDGFVLGDGAGVLLLEELQHAQRRGARIYAEVVGFGMSGDAYHMTLPDPSGDGARRSMLNALSDAELGADRIDYVNAHATSTPAGDKLELAAMVAAFGDHAQRVAISSTKSMTGHLLGAAGGIEAVFSVLALRDQVAPPTINLDNPESDYDLNLVAKEPQQRQLKAVLSNSFGFGGTNGSLIFQQLS